MFFAICCQVRDAEFVFHDEGVDARARPLGHILIMGNAFVSYAPAIRAGSGRSFSGHRIVLAFAGIRQCVVHMKALRQVDLPLP